MRILFASGRSYLPHRIDGAILSVHALLQMLQARGHHCEAVVGVGADAPLGAAAYRVRRFLTGRRVPGWPDGRNGYRTFRAWEPLVPQLVRERISAIRPDLVLTQLDSSETIAATALAASIPTILFVRDAEFRWHTGTLAACAQLQLVASSRFVADRVAERLGVDAPHLYPIVQPERYRVGRRESRYVTLVNPTRVKGIELALQVAEQLPHREFLLVESWPIPSSRRRELRRRLRRLPNVRLRKRVMDMRRIYRQTALLMMPSQWDEAFGRVVLEAQVNGIPVVASRVGGVPEALAAGGVLLPPDGSPAHWAAAVEQALADPRHYHRLSRQARENAAQPQFDAHALVDRFLHIASAVLEPGLVRGLAVPGPPPVAFAPSLSIIPRER